MSRAGIEVKLAFAVALFGAAGCNALLGNGYGVDDSESSLLDGGGGGDDALVEGGSGDDGGVGPDGSPTGDGSVLPDADVDAASCPNGVCPTLLTTVTGPQRLALSATGVYWASAALIGRIDLDGGNKKTQTPGGTMAAGLKRGIAVNPLAGGSVYFTMPGAGKGAAKCTADLLSCTLPGFIGSAGDASSIFANGTQVFVGIFNSGAGLGGIWGTDLNGGSLQSYTMTDIVLDLQVVGAKTYFRTATAINSTTPTTTPVSAANLLGDNPIAFVISGTTLMVATTNLHLHACTVGGAACNAVVVRMTDAPPVAITADATHVYWAEGDNLGGTIHRCSLPDCTSPQLLADGQIAPTAIAVDTTSVYWATYGDGMNPNGTIMKLMK